jgi:hypothetical protein
VPDQLNPVAKTLTSFALRYALGFTHAEGGGFGTDVEDSEELVRQLIEAFPVHCQLENLDIFEKENMLVRLNHRLNREYINVEVFKPMPRECIPSFLWEYTHGGGAFHGMFIPDRPEQ